ncbi:MAG: hypothetical protein GY928_11290 [Colwellia sp.]|nr:hypothetical protein [Colwellia sp.]
MSRVKDKEKIARIYVGELPLIKKIIEQLGLKDIFLKYIKPHKNEKIPGKTRSGLKLEHGHSKDHRPDLKQILYSLTISADGAVPIHYKTYEGSRTDDTTHIETWNMLYKIIGNPSFLYVADSKVCTKKRMMAKDGWII